jgi:hypothetical protein
MITQTICPCCNNMTKKVEKIESTVKTRDNYNNIVEVKVTRVNDGFFEVTQGKYKGNLIHVWSVII